MSHMHAQVYAHVHVGANFRAGSWRGSVFDIYISLDRTEMKFASKQISGSGMDGGCKLRPCPAATSSFSSPIRGSSGFVSFRNLSAPDLSASGNVSFPSPLRGGGLGPTKSSTQRSAYCALLCVARLRPLVNLQRQRIVSTLQATWSYRW